MYIYPKKLESITHKIIRLPKSRLEKAKELNLKPNLIILKEILTNY